MLLKDGGIILRHKGDSRKHWFDKNLGEFSWKAYPIYLQLFKGNLAQILGQVNKI